MLLKQAREGQKALVNEDPQTISVSVSADPTDPWASKTTEEFTGRISHEDAGPENLKAGTAGLSTNLGRFLSVQHDVSLQKGDTITDKNGKLWKLGPIDALEKFGGVYGYQCSLEDAS
jgi:hypothetical protein